jgi:biotin operon repressor
MREKGQASGKELSDFLAITDRAVRKQIGKMYSQGIILKTGKPPRVFYFIKGKKPIINKVNIDSATRKIIDDAYIIITPSGEMKNGMEGFAYWCDRNKLPVEKTANEYVKTLEKYDAWKKDGLIDATEKIASSFEKAGLNRLYYIDFYSIERFGKTKLGQLLLYAKQSQDKGLMKEIADIARPAIMAIIKKHEIDGVGFIPPTVKREIQLMKELRRMLNIPIKEINIVKARTEVSVPQKTLNRLEDRVENAKSSIFVDDNGAYENILLIDDAVGSGATLNETALQLKKRGMVIGLAVTGSFKGFDVISEV